LQDKSFLKKTKTWTRFKETRGLHSVRRSRVPTSLFITEECKNGFTIL
jgi:hypothetical protein